ncbi:hypothetical protein [Streptomyces gilvosporeus]|uniref:Uncharacterized protein n=1 Tax=Streptomyces gilvosporeus TaxID=553510 RepID=A0A1V0TJJ5_9ACTN|nr:hypothetical protein [Streptomyces gilvosporeus]ARF53089.1 hypothetical protein B1H19_01840 [Streptomyces gilvosporeus]
MEIGKQLATLEALLDGLMPKATAGEARTAEVIFQALDRHARLLGIDAPVKVWAPYSSGRSMPQSAWLVRFLR